MATSSSTEAVSAPLPWYKVAFHPTALTAARIVLAPVIIIALYFGENVDALCFFVVAELTDFFDGYLARRWGLASRFGELLDTLADKILHVPLFIYFLAYPKPKLPHFFLIHDVMDRIGYLRLLFVIVAIELVLLATRWAGMQDTIDWAANVTRFNRYGELRVTKKRAAKKYGKIKTWIHAFSTGHYILATVMVGAVTAHYHTDTIATVVTVAQILVVPSIGFALLSLLSRFIFRLFRRKQPA